MFLNFLKKNMFDLNLFFQSTPSLGISCIGLLITGNILEYSIKNKEIKMFPVLLLSNCILNFKGNIELLYAMYLSSMRKNRFISYKAYLKYTFDNGNLVLFQSIVIGFTVGIIGISKIVLCGKVDSHVCTVIMTTSLISCFLTSIIFIFTLYLTIEFSEYFNIDPDNVILPCIGALTDYISVKSLLLLFERFSHLPNNLLLFYSILALLTSPFCLVIILKSKRKMPIQSVETLAFTYILSTISGYLLDYFSNKYSFIASFFPVYSGLAVSISYIYLHKIFTAIRNNTEHDKSTSYITLLFISFFMIISYSLLSMIIIGRKPYTFYSMFVILFLSQVIILLKLIESLSSRLQYLQGDVGVVSLPILAAVGDTISTIFLIGIATLNKFHK